MHPELYVGRILANDSSQISHYTDKVFRYELNPGNGDYSYLTKALLTESHDHLGFLASAAEKLISIGLDTLFIRENDYSRFPKGCDIIDAINTNQFGFISTFNHGDPAAIITYGFSLDSIYSDKIYWLWAIDTVKMASGYHPGTDEEEGNGLNYMNNRDFPMVYYNLACKTAKYDYEGIPMNYGESFTTGKDYGGPAFLGHTSSISDIGAQLLFSGFLSYIKTGHTRIGEAEALSRNYSCHNQNMIVAHSHNLLGDPSIDLWTETPRFFDDITITRSNTSITISGIQDTYSAIVVYYNNDGECITKVSSSDCIFNNVSPNGSVMLFQHNYIPFIAPLVLQNTTMNHSQYLIATDVTAGHSIDANRTNGDVIIKNGINYEIEASGIVRLDDGFKVEKGGRFAVYPSAF